MDMLIKAGLVYPVSSPPIPNGHIAIEGGRIRAVGGAADFGSSSSGPVIDLSGHIVMPGFVNAHSHLQFASARKKFHPDSGFVDWIRQVIAFSRAVPAREREEGMRAGIAEMLASGATAVGDIVSDPEFAKPFVTAKIRSVVFIESIAPDPAEAQTIAENVMGQVDTLSQMGLKAGISPHAPHTVSGALFKLLAKGAHALPLKLTSHVAESAEEDEYIRNGAGPMSAFFEERGIPLANAKGMSPVRLLDSYGALDGLVAAHLNLLDENDLQLLEKRHAAPVFCPGSSRWFGRERVMPFDRMIQMGLRPALGTDSLASNGALSMLDEMRSAAVYFPAHDREKIIEAATLNGALALGLDCGSIVPGKFADLIAFRWDGRENPVEVIFSATRPDFVMIGGTAVLPWEITGNGKRTKRNDR
ncbi:MAG: amidohydrolase family protein [Nitrospinae bacterium]|nr:amidohydrolase family protein [Nitrospinota bacterium]